MNSLLLNKNISEVRIQLMSPEDTRLLSYGEVTKAATISYKNQTPEEGGLFCQRIFGPDQDYQCACGKYSQLRNRGKVCEVCGVEIARNLVRRERFGHIELEAPVTHIWMLKAIPSKIATVLNVKSKSIDEVAYYVSYIVIDPGKTNLEPKTFIDQKNGRAIFLEQLLEIQKQFDNKKLFTDLSEQEAKFLNDSIKHYIKELHEVGYNYSFEEILEFICECTGANIETGAEAIKVLLKNIDLEDEIHRVKFALKKSSYTNEKLIKRLAILESFLSSNNQPHDMVLENILILPAGLRPIVTVNGDRYTASELNELYRRILIRNSRLRELKTKYPAKIILNNEKRLLQESVDSLFDNQRRDRPVKNKAKRPLKSLAEFLKGKSGRFRQNLLGKRVDYSGRSIIVIGPELKMYQCGLPREIALELYKPFIIAKILEENSLDIYNPRIIDNLIKKQDNLIWPYLEKVIKERPVLLNRAPSLHRMSIQAFEPILTRDKAIKLHPLSTTAFNADFDGDQMAVHLPLSEKAVSEARSLMLGSKNIIGLKDGKPIAKMTQDMILGIYYLTKTNKFTNKINLIGSIDQIWIGLNNKTIMLHDLVLYSVKDIADKGFLAKEKDCYLITTPGKIIFNANLPKSQRYYNNFDLLAINQKDLITFNPKNSGVAQLISDRKQLETVLQNYESSRPFNDDAINNILLETYNSFKENTSKYLDNLKNLGFKYSTESGITVSAYDLQFKRGLNADDEILIKKNTLVAATGKKINEVDNLFNYGMLTDEDLYEAKINLWAETKDHVQAFLQVYLENEEVKQNPLFQIYDSGARGNLSNFVQLSGMRGLMVSPKGKIIETPITSSFKEGLQMIEFFISTHGARKGMADTALKTADSGYLTRRLVDVAQDVVVTEVDCGSTLGFKLRDISDTKTDSIIINLETRLLGRVLSNDLYNKNKTLIAKRNTLIDQNLAKKIIGAKIDNVKIRSVLNCNTSGGICAFCYGYDLSCNEMVKPGTPVGVISAQSIGEPCTQLTMRTFHTGGVAGDKDITQGLPRIKELLDVVPSKNKVAVMCEYDAVVKEIKEINYGQIQVSLERIYYRKNKKQTEIEVIEISKESILRIKKGQKLKAGDKITDGALNLTKLLEFADVYCVQKYILKEILRVYILQGIYISEKHIEIILSKMMSKVRVVDQGDSNYLLGSYVTTTLFKECNAKLLSENKNPALGIPMLLGLKKTPQESDSFLSAIAFQDTVRLLTNSAIQGRVDKLRHIKENVIMGKLIPCGTGLLSDEEILTMGEKALESEY